MGGEVGRQRIPIRRDVEASLAVSTPVSPMAPQEAVIGDTRRPYGVDQLALAVACAEPGGDPIASATFGIFRPVDFYRDGGVSDRVLDFVRETGSAHLEARDNTVRFAAALFSWGDVARETIFNDDDEEAA